MHLNRALEHRHPIRRSVTFMHPTKIEFATRFGSGIR
jgi:hypothetical protein